CSLRPLVPFFLPFDAFARAPSWMSTLCQPLLSLAALDTFTFLFIHVFGVRKVSSLFDI
ncbi:unnamed protein product, partial [Laminaria digitata]